MVRKKKPDRRTQRTRHSLTHAMVELVTEKRFDDITVQNLIDNADIGRSTFYTHFRDKEDLFQKNWEGFVDFCAQKITWEKAGRGSFMPIIFLFDHLKDVQPFYQGLDASATGIETTIRESWAKGGKVTSFKRGLIPLISYLIAHESHHRGSILLTLKQTGHKLSDELKWGLWDWNRL